MCVRNYTTYGCGCHAHPTMNPCMRIRDKQQQVAFFKTYLPSMATWVKTSRDCGNVLPIHLTLPQCRNCARCSSSEAPSFHRVSSSTLPLQNPIRNRAPEPAIFRREKQGRAADKEDEKTKSLPSLALAESESVGSHTTLPPSDQVPKRRRNHTSLSRELAKNDGADGMFMPTPPSIGPMHFIRGGADVGPPPPPAIPAPPPAPPLPEYQIYLNALPQGLGRNRVAELLERKRALDEQQKIVAATQGGAARWAGLTRKLTKGGDTDGKHRQNQKAPFKLDIDGTSDVSFVCQRARQLEPEGVFGHSKPMR